MKIILYIIIGFISIFKVNDQNREYLGEVEYHKTQNTSGIISTETFLIFNNHKSYFEWFSRKQGVEKSKDGTTSHYANSEKTKDAPYFMLNDRIENKFYTRLINDDKFYLIEKPSNFIKWHILDDKKYIDKFLCQKAVAEYKGRKYIGWFTLEIPVPYGPAYLQGLPGLVLEAYEENYFVHFIAKKITLNNLQFTIEDKIKDIDFSKTITAEDYENAISIYEKNLQAQINSRRPKGSKPIIFKTNCEDCGEKTEVKSGQD